MLKGNQNNRIEKMYLKTWPYRVKESTCNTAGKIKTGKMKLIVFFSHGNFPRQDKDILRNEEQTKGFYTHLNVLQV